MASFTSSQFATISHRDVIPPPPTAICCSQAPIPQSISNNLYINHFIEALQALKHQGALTNTPLFRTYTRPLTQTKLWPPPSHRVIKLQICTNASDFNRDFRHVRYFIFQCDIEDVETISSNTKPIKEVSEAHMFPAEVWREIDESVVDYWIQFDAKENGVLWMEKESKPKDGEEVSWVCKRCDVQVWIKELRVSTI